MATNPIDWSQFSPVTVESANDTVDWSQFTLADEYDGPGMSAAPISRTFGEFMSDQRHAAGEGVASAVGGLIEAPGGLINAAVAYSPLRMAIEKLSPSTGVGIQRALHVEQPEIVKKAAGVFHDIAEDQRSKLSTDHQLQAEQLNDVDGAWDTAKFLATNPAYTATEATKVLAQMAPGGVVAKGVTTAGALARGAQSVLAGERAATAFNVGSQAAMAGSLQGNEVRATLEAMPMEKLKAQPEFGRIKAALETDSDEEARDWLIKNAESNAFAESFAINAATPFMIPHGATLEKAMLGQGAAGASRWRNALLGGAGEAAEEGIAESGEQISQNVRTFRPWDEGVGKAGALGAVLGAGMGVLAGAFQSPKPIEDGENLLGDGNARGALADAIKKQQERAAQPKPQPDAVVDPQTSLALNPLLDADRIKTLQGDPELAADPANVAPKRRQITPDEVTRRAQAKLAELDALAAEDGGLTASEAELQTVLRRNVGNPAMLANMLDADLVAPAAQDQAQVPEPQQPEAPPRAEPPTQAGIVAPLTPSWVNQETGEVAIPGREDMRAALESQMQAQFAAHGNTAVDAEAIAYAWLASGIEVSPTAIAKVARDVRKTFTPAGNAPANPENASASDSMRAQPTATAVPFQDANPEPILGAGTHAPQGAQDGEQGGDSATTQTTSGDAIASDTTMQNRDRSRVASVAQMRSIRNDPDPQRLGFSRDPNTGAPMVSEGAAIPEPDKGRADTVVMASGRRVPVRYAVVEADSIAASHDVNGRANPDYEAAPLKALNNGRTAGLQAAHQSGSAVNYVSGIQEDSPIHGVSPEAIASKRAPVLVRLYDPSENRGDMGAESNASAQLGMSPSEQAKTDARALPALDSIQWAADGSLSPSVNADFFRSWFKNMGEAQAASLMDADGKPNAAAVQRVRSALVQRAYSDDRLLMALSEEVNPDNRNIMNALVRSAPAFASLEQEDPLTRDVRGRITEALEFVRQASRDGTPVDSALAQGDMLGREKESDDLARFMGQNARSVTRMADAFSAMAEYVNRAQAQAATLDIFGNAPKPSVRAAIVAANQALREKHGEQYRIEVQPERIYGDSQLGDRGGEREGGGRAATGEAGRVEDVPGGTGGGFQLAKQSAPTEQTGQVAPASQGALLAPPTTREAVDAEVRRRDAERNGRTGNADQSMLAGDGTLFATRGDQPAPNQMDVEDQAGAGANTTIDTAGVASRDDTDSPATRSERDSNAPAKTKPDIGDRVNITGGTHKGKSGVVASAGKNYGITFDDGSTGRVGPKAVQKAVSIRRETVDPASNPIVGKANPATPTYPDNRGEWSGADKTIGTVGDVQGSVQGNPSRTNPQGDSTTPDKGKPANTNGDTTPTKLDDFGEKLEGARKDLPPSLKEELSDDQIATQPLSKIWPADAHEGIEDDTAAALTFAARAEIPAKPRVAHKLRRWVEQVKMLRDMVRNPDDARLFIEKGNEIQGVRGLGGFFAKVRMLTQLPREHWKRIGKVAEYPSAHRYKDGKQVAAPFSEVQIDGKSHRLPIGKIGPDEVQKVLELLGAAAPAKDSLTAKDFEIRMPRGGGSAFINRKGDKEYRPLKTFTGDDAVKQARAWLKDHVADAEAEWEAVKARDNIAMGDERRDENRERTGPNRRNGKDVTPEMFNEAFGFRGTQFGNYVKQGKGAKDRQGMLNDAYDALLDLAELLGIPSRAISLNGTLGLAFGARGSGRAGAHFEPSNLVINLTKTRGAGSLAHEWFHALDNYFSRMRRGGKEHPMGTSQDDYRRNNFITYRPEPVWTIERQGKYGPMRDTATSAQLRQGLQSSGQWVDGKTLEENAKAAGWSRDAATPEGVRVQVEAAFAELTKALNASPMASRALAMSKGKSEGYWNQIIERGARSFENYILSKMAQRGWSNDFLANIRDWQDWHDSGKNAERYPYLKPEEEAPIVEAFDNLFETIESRTDPESGNVALFNRRRRAVADGSPIPRSRLDSLVDHLTRNHPDGKARVRIASRWVDLPAEVRAEAERQGFDPATEAMPGVAYKGDVYLVHEYLTSEKLVEETLFHERVHQVLRNNTRDPDSTQLRSALQSLYTSLGGRDGLRQAATQAGVSHRPSERQGNALRQAMLREAKAQGTPDLLAVRQANIARNVLTMEEFLADLEGGRAYENVPKTLQRKFHEALGRLRQWLRDHGFTRLAKALGQDLDTTNLADLRALLWGIRQQVAGTGDSAVRFIRVWHGTPHRGIEQTGFQLNKIGTGEGAQAYGWGMYFASRREVGESYRASTARPEVEIGGRRFKADGGGTYRDENNIPLGSTQKQAYEDASRGLYGSKAGQSVTSLAEEAESYLQSRSWMTNERIAEAKKAILNGEVKLINEGQLYSAEIPDDHDLLDWDKPLSEQPEKVREAVAAAHIPRQSEYGGEYNAASWPEGMTGGQWYGKLASALSGGRVDYDAARSGAGGGQRAASEYLQSLGIPGLRYLDGQSRRRPLKDIKREFLAELPEDADFADVVELLGTGAFSPKNEAVVRALTDAGWLGFDYPAQALSAALSSQINNFDPTPALVRAVSDAQEGGTHNYVIWDESLLTPEAAEITPYYSRAERRDDGDAEIRAMVEQYAGVDGAPTEAEIREAIKQYRDAERAYGGRPAYDKAKADGRTKLTYGQWVQVRTPNFKRWFGDWEALRAQERLDAMKPVTVRVPDGWRGLSEGEMRAKMAETLDALVQRKAVIQHPELGEIKVGRRGAKKTETSSKDPADMLVANDLEAALPKSIYARTESSSEQGVSGYTRLLLPVRIDGKELVAILTIRRQTDGDWYYNTVTVQDAGKEKRPGSYASPGADGPLGQTPITGLADFVRRPLTRVNPDDVSKVVDPETGEPMVVYHGTNRSFDAFSRDAESRFIPLPGLFFTPDPAIASRFSETSDVESSSQITGSNVMPVFVALKIPASIDASNETHGRMPSAGWVRREIEKAEADVQDGAVIQGWRDGSGPIQYVAFHPTQIKSATANIGTFDPTNPDIRFSQPDQSGPSFLTRAADVQAAVLRVLDTWKGDKPVVRVVQSMAEARKQGAKLPADAPSDVEGWWDGDSTVWIVAGNNRDVDRALETLSHEAIGHYGIERVMGKEAWTRLVADVKRLRGLKQSDVSPKIWKALQSAERRYGNESAETFAKEFLAIMAEQGVRSGLTMRVVAKIRQFLAKLGIPMNISKAFREAELLDALYRGRKWVERGDRSTLATSPAMPAQGLAFSRKHEAESDDFSSFDVRDLSADQVALLQSLGLVTNEQADLLEDESEDGQARSAARRVLRDIAPTMTKAEIDAKLAALAQVKARLQDLPPAVRVPNIDGEMTPELKGRITRLGYFLQGFTQDNPDAFDYGQAPEGEKDIQKIADAMLERQEIAPTFTQGKTDAKGVQHWTISTPDGREGTFEVELGGVLQLHIGDFLKNSGQGSALYAVFNTWAARNGYKALPDRAGLSEVNKYRRTASMLSSALREGSTAHLMPHPDQHLPHWVGGKGANTTAFNIGYMALREAKRVLAPKTAKLRIHLLDRVRYDFDQHQFVDSKGRGISVGEHDSVLSQAAAGQGAVGRRSAQRASFAATSWAEIERRGLSTGREAQAWGSAAAHAGAQSGVRALADPTGHAKGHSDTLVLDGPLTMGRAFYSRPDPSPSNPTGSPLVGNEPAIASNFEKLLRPGKAALTAAKNLIEQSRPVWLGAFTLDQLVELGKKYLPQMKHYADILQALDTDRNVMQEEAGVFAEEWQKWAAKHRKENIAAMDLMHAATIAGTDPAEDFAPLPIMFGGKKLEATKENVKQVLLAIREQMRGRAGDSKREMLARSREVRGIIKRNARRAADHAVLRKQWDALSPEAKAMYVRARNMYSKRRDQREAALIGRIRDMKMDDRRKQATIAQIRLMFESQRVQAPYFPLQRQGDFWISAESPNGEPTYIMREKVGEWEKEIAALKAAGFKIKATGRKGERTRLLDGASAKFITEVIQHLQKTGAPVQAQDDIYQMYLRSLPDMSQRKHAIHRKVVSGYGQDAIRNFASNMLHEAHQIARLKYSHQLEGFVNLAEEHNNAKRKADDADPKHIAAADAMLGELKKRHEWIMNPSNSKLASAATSLGFVYYLGLTPASALVNLTQVAQTTLPHMAANPDIGLTRASALLTSAMKDAIRTGGNIEKTLTKPEELKAFRELVARGVIDKSQAHNLAGLSEGDSTQYNPAFAKAMNVIAFMFHKAEVVNREATGMAAFRAMRQAGKGFDEAVEFAAETINTTHFNYSNQNRPRWMQSNVAKVLFLFKQYSQNMTWFLGRNAYQALKGETKAVRRQALKTLAGTLGTTGVMAGALGMPLLPIVFTVLNAVAASFGDDDDYFDAETEFRNFLADVLGQRGGRIVTEGLVNELTGANISGRVGLDELWIREPNRELEGRDAFAYYLEQLAGPVFGMGKNVFVGKQLMDDGHILRGMETILPKALRDGIKSYRFASEGVNTLRGDPVIEGVSPWQLAMQASGFSLAEAATQYEANNAAMKFEAHVLGRRQALMDAYALALRLDDLQAHAKVIDAIGRFNAKYPELGIKASTLRNSLRARQRYSDRSQGGVVLNPNLADRSREQARFGAGSP